MVGGLEKMTAWLFFGSDTVVVEVDRYRYDLGLGNTCLRTQRPRRLCGFRSPDFRSYNLQLRLDLFPNPLQVFLG